MSLKTSLTGEKLKKIFEILTQFTSNPNKRLNLHKLQKIVDLNESEMKVVVNLILDLQTFFRYDLNRYRLSFLHNKGIPYLDLEPIDTPSRIQHKIILSEEELNIISDATFVYRNINNGDGFNIHFTNGLEKKIIYLSRIHPYFFRRVNSHILPSKLCLHLGDKILQYRKLHKNLNKIEIGEFLIKVE
jgi:hypothetical protein